jgi:hypothetical protein
LVFANDPNRYFDLFEKIDVDEEKLDWVIPQTEADVAHMMDQLERAGIMSGDDDG